MKKNTITYYIIPTERFGHGAVQFGNGNILGKYPDLGKPRKGDKAGKNLVDDRNEVDIKGVVKVTASYPDSKQYNAAKEKYEKDAGSYWPIGENCIDYLNNIHVDAGGQGTIGMQFSLEQINNMGGPLASNYMKSKYGYKELTEVRNLLPNQESAIERQYNLPPGSVKFSGTKYKASESGDHIEFQYEINNPINSQENSGTKQKEQNPVVAKLERLSKKAELEGKNELAEGLKKTAGIAEYGSNIMDIASEATEGSHDSLESFNKMQEDFNKRGMHQEAKIAGNLGESTKLFTDLADMFLGEEEKDTQQTFDEEIKEQIESINPGSVAKGMKYATELFAEVADIFIKNNEQEHNDL